MFHFVDDNQTMLEFVAAVAAAEGHESRTFDSPLTYLEYAASEAFEMPLALFSDVMMPEMNGLEMLKRVRELHPGIRTAVISGYAAERDYEAHCLYLRKPAQPETLQTVFRLFQRCCSENPGLVFIACQDNPASGAYRMDCRSCPYVEAKEEAD